MKKKITRLSVSNIFGLFTLSILKCCTLILLLCLLFYGCTRERGTGSLELDKILNHYPKGTLQSRAAIYLIENMKYHVSQFDERAEVYRDKLMNMDILIDYRTEDLCNAIWDSINNTYNVRSNPYKKHVDRISADFLIPEIDFAFTVWENAPWSKTFTFEVFQEYVLPYAVKDEPLVAWRKPLYEKYHPMIKGIEDPKKAFDMIYNHLMDEYYFIDLHFPFNHDPLFTDKLMGGSCDNRTIFITCVARALGIPATFDFVPTWGNYSTIAHSWVAFVPEPDKAFVFSQFDSVSHHRGIIDASLTRINFAFNDSSTSYKVDSLRTTPKIFRRSFTIHIPDELHDRQLPHRFRGVNVKDVSAIYGLDHSFTVRTKEKEYKNSYLCTFTTGQGWEPLDFKIQKSANITFGNLGPSVFYLPVTYLNNEFVPLSNPVLIDNEGKQTVFDPLITDTERVVLKRKYQMSLRWIRRWHDAIGTKFEVADNKAFHRAELLHTISAISIGKTDVSVHPSKPYRYFRFVIPEDVNPAMAELALYSIDDQGNKKELKGSAWGYGLSKVDPSRLFDKDYSTFIRPDQSYWVGIDLGADNRERIDEVHYCLWHDSNFIDIGDTYELYFYNYGWRSLGQQIAVTDSLIFDNVPRNSVLWLRDLTKGKEERIFTYKDGKQQWW